MHLGLSDICGSREDGGAKKIPRRHLYSLEIRHHTNKLKCSINNLNGKKFYESEIRHRRDECANQHNHVFHQLHIHVQSIVEHGSART